MSKEGYLILHEEGKRSQIYYCVLGEGKFQFYSRRDSGVLVKEITLSRTKLKIRGVPDEEARDCSYSFSVRLQRSKIRDGRQIVYGKPLLLILSAPTWDERKAWGNAIHAWQRNYWGEPQHREMNMSEDEIDVFFETQRKALQISIQTTDVSSPERSPTKSRLFFTRAPQSLKSMGSKVGKKIRSSSKITFSLPPMGLSISSSMQQQTAH